MSCSLPPHQLPQRATVQPEGSAACGITGWVATLMFLSFVLPGHLWRFQPWPCLFSFLFSALRVSPFKKYRQYIHMVQKPENIKRLEMKNFPSTPSAICLISIFLSLSDNHFLVLVYLLLEFLCACVSKYNMLSIFPLNSLLGILLYILLFSLHSVL